MPRDWENSLNAGFSNDRTKLIALGRFHLHQLALQNCWIRRRRSCFDEIVKLADVHPDVAVGARERFIDLGDGHLRMADVLALVPLMRPEAYEATVVWWGDVDESQINGLGLVGALLQSLESGAEQVGEVRTAERVMGRAGEIADEQLEFELESAAEFACEPSGINQRRRKPHVHRARQLS